jgi:hypothetical protein
MGRLLAVSSSLVFVLLATAAESAAYPPPEPAKLPGKSGSTAATRRVEDTDPSGTPKADNRPNLRVWHDAKGWHVQTHGERARARRYQGKIRIVKGQILGLKGEAGEAPSTKKGQPPREGDFGQWNPREINFRFLTAQGNDGFTFQVSPDADLLEFHVLSDGGEMPLDRIFIGREGKHPSQNTFFLRANPPTK